MNDFLSTHHKIQTSYFMTYYVVADTVGYAPYLFSSLIFTEILDFV